jgi:hypothetical protein
MKLYTFVVLYLQMCMKEYGCCPTFKRGDDSTYTFTKKGGGVYLVSNFTFSLLIILVNNKLVYHFTVFREIPIYTGYSCVILNKYTLY